MPPFSVPLMKPWAKTSPDLKAFSELVSVDARWHRAKYVQPRARDPPTMCSALASHQVHVCGMTLCATADANVQVPSSEG